jgi:hypothetical protein
MDWTFETKAAPGGGGYKMPDLTIIKGFTRTGEESFAYNGLQNGKGLSLAVKGY